MPSTAKRKKGMPFEVFLKHLRTLKGQFSLRGTEQALRMARTVCPISAVCNKIRGTHYDTFIYKPAAEIGMSRLMAKRVADAADSPSFLLLPVARNYRNRMLRALKLREVVA